ncbi:hypothetical protein SODALDRAFT_333528 [Sodiomyces alkalinus F11]|uniref:Uncharacterized protein n=1 Tax=Sodiomyces alkalinus (strain CBS 110278 / VKM F-3762 / F11) TaxID=1314773 RepID=A0A3N2PTE3_SODAK|nr:hypothetical protein SODALDRAFT_333528 [Sodiomyces alkalinus F11]ROT37777.1 hypothetical protein SODALDRAFT_333528 [Sodiomyces alkalinus F11]
MSRPASQVYKHYQRALSLWPKDELRPHVQFPDFVMRGIQKRLDPTTKAPLDPKRELAQLNALCSLAEDRYVKKFPTGHKILNPKSQPTYFKDLLREMEEAPSRTWLQNVSKKLTGMFRWE